VTGRVDQIQLIFRTVFRLIRHTHRFGFDRDPALALEFHRIEHLIGHVAKLHHAGLFENAIRQRRFAVVDMRDNAKIANFTLIVIGHVRSSMPYIPR